MYGRPQTNTWTPTTPAYTSSTTSSSVPLPYGNFESVAGSSNASPNMPPQSALFQFPPYPTVPVPFDYPQVTIFFFNSLHCFLILYTMK